MDRILQKLQQFTAPEPPAPAASVPVTPAHPFYPLGIELVHYVANDRNVVAMLTLFLSGWAVILGTTWVVTGKIVPQLKTRDKLAVIWFVLTGTIHFFFEGYFSYNHADMSSAQDLFGQLWKEYAMSDSRYLTSDPFVLCMETVTAVLWGPLSYFIVYFIVTNHPLRYPIQGLVCIGQIYGDILYYATSMFDFYYKGLSYCRPEPYYFWFYYFFFNFIWIVIPGYLLYESVEVTRQAFDALKRMSKSMQTNGGTKLPQADGQVKVSKANGHLKKN